MVSLNQQSKKESKVVETNTIVRLSESGEVSIPPLIREFLHWQSGMELNVRITSSGLLIQPKQPQVKKRRLEEFRGFLKHQGKPLSDEQLCAPVNHMESK